MSGNQGSKTRNKPKTKAKGINKQTFVKPSRYAKSKSRNLLLTAKEDNLRSSIEIIEFQQARIQNNTTNLVTSSSTVSHQTPTPPLDKNSISAAPQIVTLRKAPVPVMTKSPAKQVQSKKKTANDQALSKPSTNHSVRFKLSVVALFVATIALVFLIGSAYDQYRVTQELSSAMSNILMLSPTVFMLFVIGMFTSYQSC